VAAVLVRSNYHNVTLAEQAGCTLPNLFTALMSNVQLAAGMFALLLFSVPFVHDRKAGIARRGAVCSPINTYISLRYTLIHINPKRRLGVD